MKAVIVIPVYKPQPNADERASLLQCLHVLGKHDICMVCPTSLDTSAYEQEFHKAGVPFHAERFDDGFFRSQRDYNRLMLTKDFYLRFQAWEYMLIYQLDAYVFSDQLEEWCRKGYDYVGAPFLKLNREVDPMNSGNGGFSLRRIQKFIDVFSVKGKVLTARGLWRFYRYRGPLHRLPLTLRGIFGYRNHLKDFMNWQTANEDLFYAMLDDSVLKWRIAHTPEAMYFSYEGRPSWLYARTGRLPFGCHAFRQNEFDTFYSQYIHPEA